MQESGEDRMSTGELVARLEKLRLDLGWAQNRMADNLGVSEATYSRWVRGVGRPHGVIASSPEFQRGIVRAEEALENWREQRERRAHRE